MVNTQWPRFIATNVDWATWLKQCPLWSELRGHPFESQPVPSISRPPPVSTGKYQNSTSFKPWQLPFTSWQSVIHYSSYHSVLVWDMAATLNNPQEVSMIYTSLHAVCSVSVMSVISYIVFFFFGNRILFAVCTSTNSKLCKNLCCGM